MGQGNAIAFKARSVETRQQNQQRGAGADYEGVEEYAECLNHTLSNRVINIGHGSDVRGTAQTGFVGEYTAFDAHDNGTADQAAKHRVDTEGALDDMAQHGWHVIELQHNHVQGDCDIGQGLDRYQKVSHRSDTLDATDKHQA